jgi:hypothetical protein
MATINLQVGWIAVLAGLASGAVIGSFFHRQEWLGGYGSWRRRMVRLAHISLVGTGLLNVVFALSAGALKVASFPRAASVLFLVGAATMSPVCALAAWRPAFRHLFFVPVASLILGSLEVVYLAVRP